MKLKCGVSMVALALANAACGSSAEREPGNGSGEKPAVMVATALRTPEGTMNMYVGAYRELPAEPDLSDMVETAGGHNASAFDGYIFVWSPESGEYTRYAVDDELRLSQDGVVSFVNLGGTGNVMTRFISPTRAYSMTRDNLSIIVWNPRAMETIGTIDTSAAIDPDYPSFDYGEPVLFDGYVAWPILWYDYDKLHFKPSVDVLFARADTDEPAFALSDPRCGGGWSLFTDPEGDLYAATPGSASRTSSIKIRHVNRTTACCASDPAAASSTRAFTST